MGENLSGGLNVLREVIKLIAQNLVEFFELESISLEHFIDIAFVLFLILSLDLGFIVLKQEIPFRQDSTFLYEIGLNDVIGVP